jgi:hypothetical protein
LVKFWKSKVLLIVGLSLFLAVGALILHLQAQADVPAGAIALSADNNSDHDPVWEKRHYYFKPSWGIRGSGEVEGGSIWFDSFPGEDGRYLVEIETIAEQDGSSPLKLYSGESLLYDGRIPYLKGVRDCNARGGALKLDLGEHQIKKGEKIRIWAESVYECGEKGAYALWYRLVFTPRS